MKLAGFESGSGVWIGAVDPNGALRPIAEREAFWRDPFAAIGSPASAEAIAPGQWRERPAAPLGARVLCVGLNYRKHAEESGAAIPSLPVVFARWTAGLAVNGEDVPLPEERYDWEAELGVIIGKPLFRVPKERALAGVFGYCAFNDLSARTYQRQTLQWALGKNAEKSAPMSAIVTADEVKDPAQGLGVRARVNGAVMQDDSTADMIFTVPEIIAHITEVMVLRPGDVIATGTPSGVGMARNPPIFLKVGDEVEIEIAGVGKVSNRIVAPPASMG